MLLRLAYLAVTNVFALLRLLPMSDRDKDVEILAVRHQVAMLERQLGTTRPRFCPGDRAFLAALLHRLPRDVLGRFRLLIRPRDGAALAPGPAGAPPRGKVAPRSPGPAAHRPLDPSAGAAPGTRESVLGYRRIHGELLVLGIKTAASTVWEILRDAGIDPAPERTSATWASFLRSQHLAKGRARVIDLTQSKISRRRTGEYVADEHADKTAASEQRIGDLERPLGGLMCSGFLLLVA